MFGISTVIAILLLAVGIALIFFGRRVVESLVSGVGALLGGILGFWLVSLYTNDLILLVIAAFIGSVVLAFAFHYLTNLLLALFCGVVVFFIAHYFLQFRTFTEPYALVTLAVTVLIVGISYYFIEKLKIVVAAIIGACLAVYGLILFRVEPSWAAVIGMIMFVLGVNLQFSWVRGDETEEKK